MKIISWNVNSLTVRLPQLLTLLSTYHPDVVALQETKVPDARFPKAEIEAAGYHVCYAGQKAYNGVAIISKSEAVDTVCELPDLNDPQRRLLAATVDGVRFINVYVPNGQQLDSDKYHYKLRWLHALQQFVAQQMAQYAHVVVLGDFNIMPTDQDIHDPARWQGRIMCSDAERACFQQLLQLGLVDSLRSLHPDQPMFSWWDYRMSAFRRNWGLRIDHLLTSAALRLDAGGVAREFRGMERPSDHAPVWLHCDD